MRFRSARQPRMPIRRAPAKNHIRGSGNFENRPSAIRNPRESQNAGTKRKRSLARAKVVMQRRQSGFRAERGTNPWPEVRRRLQAFARGANQLSGAAKWPLEFGGLKSAACGSRLRRAYPPYRRCGRVAEGGGLLNRYRVVKPYRGFESLRLRHPSPIGLRDSGPRKSIPERRYGRTKVRLVDVDTSPRRRFRDAAYMIWC
jgi:hypothetical protein